MLLVSNLLIRILIKILLVVKVRDLRNNNSRNCFNLLLRISIKLLIRNIKLLLLLRNSLYFYIYVEIRSLTIWRHLNLLAIVKLLRIHILRILLHTTIATITTITTITTVTVVIITAINI